MAKTAEDALETFVITACGVISDDVFAFVAQTDERATPWKEMFEREEPTPSRIISYNARVDNWGWVQITDFKGGQIAGGTGPDGHIQALFVNHMSEVGVLNYQHGPNQFEPQRIPHAIATAPQAIRFIGSNYYTVGRQLSLARRVGSNEWESLHRETDIQNSRKTRDFEDVDGFSETDMYLGGFGSLLCHWNGKDMSFLDPGFKGGPWNDKMTIRAVCCAENGMVYLGGNFAELIAGRKGEGWTTLVPQHERNIGKINALGWFKGTLYAITDNQIFQYDAEENDWRIAVWDDDNSPGSFGYMSVKGERMLVAGPFGASVYDGATWTRLWGSVSGMDLVRATAAQTQLEAAEEGRDALRDLTDTE